MLEGISHSVHMQLCGIDEIVARLGAIKTAVWTKSTATAPR